jgi:hypothetical protein
MTHGYKKVLPEHFALLVAAVVLTACEPVAITMLGVGGGAAASRPPATDIATAAGQTSAASGHDKGGGKR